LFQVAVAEGLQGQDGKDHHPGQQSGGQHGDAQQQVEAEGGAEKLGQVGGQGGDLGRHPKRQARRPREAGATVLGKGLAGGDPQLGRQELHQHRHGVAPQQHPQQAVAEPRAPFNVGGEVAGVHVGDAGHKGRAEVPPGLAPRQARQALAYDPGLF